MTLISRLKALLGLGTRRREEPSTAVPVEREPATESERAVKEPEPVTAPTEEPPNRGVEAETDQPTTVADESVDRDDPDRTRDTAAAEPVQSLSGIGPAYAERLSEAGIETVGELASADATELAEATGLGEGRVTDWIERAREA